MSTPIAANIAAGLYSLREAVLERYDEFKLARGAGTTLPEVRELVEECAAAIGDGVRMLMGMIRTESYAVALLYICSGGGRYHNTVMVESRAAAERNFDAAIERCCSICIGGLEKWPRVDGFAISEMSDALYVLLFSTLCDALGPLETVDFEAVKGSPLGAAFTAPMERLHWMRACSKVATGAAEAEFIDVKRSRSVESKSQSQVLQKMLQNTHQMCITSIGNKLSDYAGLVASFL